MLIAADRSQSSAEKTGPEVHRRRDKCVHELFEEQVEKSPAAVAVVFGKQQWTYRELNARANSIAHRLRSLGVGPEMLVGICVERSLEMVAGLLGILKAGGAYVPIDPAYPKERIAFMVEDAAVSVLVTQDRCASVLPSSQAKCISLDSTFHDHDAPNIASCVKPENIVYVIYTSGSTGRPKGVVIEHRNVIALIDGTYPLFTAPELAGVLASTSLCFDLSIFELFVTLTRGGKVILARDILELPFLSASEQVTLVNTVPSALAELVRSKGFPSSVVTITSGGEALKTSLVQKLYQQGSIRRVNDLYGPTEDTVYSMCALRNPSGGDTIGRPLSNKQAYILDKQKQLVPVGVAGELYLGGDGLARGYLNRPDLTAEKFISNPFSATAGGRLYRTGDLCRQLASGDIVFLGRMDYQVKIRGFRIELGEIEVRLGQYPGVHQCVVMAREDEPDDKHLVAYVVPNDLQVSFSITSLRDFAAETLPQHMVPSAFVVMEKLPLTPNGKIDRNALPVPTHTRAQVREGYKAPSTPNESMLANIWTEILKIKEPGIDDNFFELGGHSLLAAQVISRIRETLEVEVPIRTFFELPTIAGLAGKLSSLRAKSAFSTPTLTSMTRNRTLPLSFTQQRLWFVDRLEGQSTEYHIAEAFRLRGKLNHGALEEAINEIVARHEILRTHFGEIEGEPVQIVEPVRRFALPLENLGAVESEAITVALEQERDNPFDLSESPPLRFKLFRLGERDHIFLSTFHHIIYDGWSAGVFNRELTALYDAFSQGQHSPLEPLAVQYADYTLWQRQWLEGEELDQRLAYWTNKLEEVPPLIPLPIDKPRTAEKSHRGEFRSLHLPESLTKALISLSQEESATLFMTLLTAFKVLLARYSGQEDIVVGTPIASRNQANMENLIGFFLSTLPLRTDLSGSPTFQETLKRVRTTALEAYTQQDLPFEKLVEKLHPERNLSYTPVFQVLFNMHNFEEVPLLLNGLELEPIPFGEPGSIWDITLYAKEEAGQIQIRAVYKPQLFEATTIERMLDRYRVLLEAIVANPKQSIGKLPLLTAQDRTRYSVHDNPVRITNEFVPFSQQEIAQSIPSRFEKTVRSNLTNVAVETVQHRWTYAELDKRANIVAHKVLQSCGSGAHRVALLLEHDAPMIAAIVGLLKSGKTYVPLDPTYPKKRLAFVLEDSQAAAIVTDAKNAELAKELNSGALSVVNLDDLNGETSCNSPNVIIPPEAIAYLLYTSGSTGIPKGVMQIHRNVLQHIRNYTNGLHICAQDRVSLLASYSFDASVMDIFGALLNGATLYPYNLHNYGFNELATWIAREEITLYHSTPTLYRHLCSTLTEEQRFPKLRLVVMGGEKVIPHDVELFQKHFDANCTFVNGYGPTESTVTLQYYADTQTPAARHNIPVGYPAEETEVLLLDARGQPGQVYGEIAIRSSSIAQGYWHRPELTDSVFQRDPELGSTMIYRTGDLGQLTANGMIEFIERKDFQVKIRGHRVELGEVETALNQLAFIKEAAVIARDDGPAGNELVAYVVMEEPGTFDSRQLRRCLSERLPSYMIPVSFVVLDKLPLTATGKIDRKALPVLPQNGSEAATDTFIIPRDEIEAHVTNIWQNSLGIRRISIRDNFFDLGGHSLLAVQLLSEIDRHFNFKFPLAALFREPTVEAMAKAIRSGKEFAPRPPRLFVWASGERKRPIFWAPSLGTVERFIECHKLVELLRDDFSFYAFDPAPEFPDIRSLSAHCVRLIREFQPRGPYSILGYCHGGHVAYDIAQQLELQGETIDLLGVLDGVANDFAPSFRMKYFWLREKLRDHPQTIAKRLGPALGRRIRRSNQVVSEKKPDTPFSVHAKAVGRHRAQLFGGRLVLFRSTDYMASLRSALFGWDALARKVEGHTIPCRHSSMLSDPAVQLISNKLKEYLGTNSGSFRSDEPSRLR